LRTSELVNGIVASIDGFLLCIQVLDRICEVSIIDVDIIFNWSSINRSDFSVYEALILDWKY